jgi:hypothetical protein
MSFSTLYNPIIFSLLSNRNIHIHKPGRLKLDTDNLLVFSFEEANTSEPAKETITTHTALTGTISIRRIKHSITRHGTSIILEGTSIVQATTRVSILVLANKVNTTKVRKQCRGYILDTGFGTIVEVVNVVNLTVFVTLATSIAAGFVVEHT